jgi:hypothetical protein
MEPAGTTTLELRRVMSPGGFRGRFFGKSALEKQMFRIIYGVLYESELPVAKDAEGFELTIPREARKLLLR